MNDKKSALKLLLLGPGIQNNRLNLILMILKQSPYYFYRKTKC